MDALNAKDLATAAGVVDTARYRENCVGFTKGFVNWEDATAWLRQVCKGIPDLHVELSDLPTGDATAIAHGIVRGTTPGGSTGHRRPSGNTRLAFSTGCASRRG
jgi:hypothetical protein